MSAHTEEEQDILREIGNIGGGHALTSLSMMLGEPLTLSVPVCRVINRKDVGSLLDNPDALYAGVATTISGTMECTLTLLLNKEFTKLVIDALGEGSSELKIESLTEMQRSALCEVGNIMGNSYITAVSELLDLKVETSVPSMVVGTGSEVLQTFIDRQPTHGDNMLFVNSSFRTDELCLDSYMLLGPAEKTLANILERISF
ncbi:MAG: chemotaxis protein CheC [Coriobacteriales bacterium]|nr:chemotaxis protein CheC [Coriobacteriales bacterium]